MARRLRPRFGAELSPTTRALYTQLRVSELADHAAPFLSPDEAVRLVDAKEAVRLADARLPVPAYEYPNTRWLSETDIIVRELAS